MFALLRFSSEMPYLAFHRQSMVSVSADCRPLYWLRYLPIVGQCVDHHSATILVDTSVDKSTNTSRSTYRPTLDRYVDRHIGRHSADMSTDTSVECRSICRPRCRPLYRSRDRRGVHKIHMIPIDCKADTTWKTFRDTNMTRTDQAGSQQWAAVSSSLGLVSSV